MIFLYAISTIALILIIAFTYNKSSLINYYNHNYKGSDESRIFYFNKALAIIKENLLLGTGFHNYHAHTKMVSNDIVHNIYMLIFSEIGLFGFLTFSLFIFCLLNFLY